MASQPARLTSASVEPWSGWAQEAAAVTSTGSWRSAIRKARSKPLDPRSSLRYRGGKIRRIVPYANFPCPRTTSQRTSVTSLRG